MSEFQIFDGTGTGNRAKVDSAGRLLGDVRATGPLEELSLDEGDAAFFNSAFTTGSTDIEVISIQNKEREKKFHITRILFGSDTAALFTLFKVTSGTAAGTALTYLNPNLSHSSVNDVTAFGGASVTGSLAGPTIFPQRVVAGTTEERFIEAALILSFNDEVAISCDVDATVEITVIGFWR